MRVDIKGLPIFIKATKEGSGVHNLAFIILEAGGVCLENELKLALENLEFILTSLLPFGMGDFRNLGGLGRGYLVY